MKPFQVLPKYQAETRTKKVVLKVINVLGLDPNDVKKLLGR